MCLWLVDTQPLHKPAVLLGSQRFGFTFFPGPLEAAGFQSLVQQHKAVAFPVQRLDAVPVSAAKQEQRICKRIQVKLLLNLRRQTVDPAAQVCVDAGNINPVSSGKVDQHDFKIRSTVSTAAASTPLWMSASISEIRNVTATPPDGRPLGASVISAKAGC